MSIEKNLNHCVVMDLSDETEYIYINNLPNIENLISTVIIYVLKNKSMLHDKNYRESLKKDIVFGKKTAELKGMCVINE